MRNPFGKRSIIAVLASILLLLQHAATYAQVTAHWQWAHGQYSASASYPYATVQNSTVCLDTSGDVITGGTYLGMALTYSTTMTGGVASMSHTQGDIFVLDSNAAFWGFLINPHSDSTLTVSKIVTDKINNIYICGSFRGGGMNATGVPLINTHAYNADMFVYKVNGTTGAEMWAKSAGGVADDNFTDMCIDNNTNVYVTGYYSSPSVVFGTTTLTHSSGSNCALVTKYNSAGNVQWALGSTRVGWSQGSKICTDSSGYLYVTGGFTDTFSLGGHTVYNPTYIASGYGASFVAKIDTNGNVIWLKHFEGYSSSFNCVVCNPRHEVYFTGCFNAPSMIMGAYTLLNPTPGGNGEIFLSRLDTSGNVVWAEAFGGTLGQSPEGVAADGYGNGYITGFFTSTNCPFGTDTLVSTFPGQPVGFVTKFDSAGHVIYALAANPSNSAGQITPSAITVNRRGDVFIVGNTHSDTILFGSIIMPDGMGSLFHGCFVAKIDSVPDCISSVTALSATTFCADDSVTLGASGISGSTWQWFLGSSSISGATSASYIAHSAGLYSVNVTNAWGCTSSSTIPVTVNPMPFAGTITGSTSVCSGGAHITLTDGTTGGVWSSSNTSYATIGTGGIVTSVAAGVDTAKYAVTNGCGVATATYLITVNPTPALSTTLTPAAICDSGVFTYAPSSSTSGATFAWSRAFVAGISNPVGSGTATVNETLVNTTYTPISVIYVFTLTASGCSNTENVTVTVNPLPNPGVITGAATVCVGASISYSDGVTGGSWSATNGAALVSGSGGVHGFSVGVDTIKYAVTNSCGTSTAKAVITVNPLPVAGTITGLDTVCVTSAITLTDGVTGGSWTAENGYAFVSGSGVVAGVTSGNDVITYTVTNSCGTAQTEHAVYVKDCSTGIKNIPVNMDEIILYPNPAGKQLTISSANQAIVRLTICNMLGQVVYDQLPGSKNIRLDISGMAPGIYFVKINGTDVRKFVKE